MIYYESAVAALRKIRSSVSVTSDRTFLVHVDLTDNEISNIGYLLESLERADKSLIRERRCSVSIGLPPD